MRKLIMWNLMSLDGYFEGETSWDLSFHQFVWGQELEELSNEQLKTAELLIFGRNTYTGMADYWTTATDEGETTGLMNHIPKYVCSKTLGKADWNNTTIIRDAVSEIASMKKEGDGNMFVFGSGNLCDALLKAGLFDEIRLCIVPALLGKGTPLFQSGLEKQRLKLVDTRRLETGGVIIRYCAG